MTTATKAWFKTAYSVMYHGRVIAPRGKTTKENLNQVISFDMNYPVVHHSRRQLNYSFMAAEAYWITSGSPLVEDIAPYCDHIAQYSDDEYIFNGAYGPAYLSQVNYVTDVLMNDQYSRQAVMTIWHPNPVKTRDYKCTIAFIFNIRNFKLNTTVQMRSSDVWLGLPYDMFNFTIMTLRILNGINRTRHPDDVYGLGEMTINAVSSHIYQDNWGSTYDVLDEDDVEDMRKISFESLTNWNYTVKSLLACRDKTAPTGLWGIRPI